MFVIAVAIEIELAGSLAESSGGRREVVAVGSPMSNWAEVDTEAVQSCIAYQRIGLDRGTPSIEDELMPAP